MLCIYGKQKQAPITPAHRCLSSGKPLSLQRAPTHMTSGIHYKENKMHPHVGGALTCQFKTFEGQLIC